MRRPERADDLDGPLTGHSEDRPEGLMTLTNGIDRFPKGCFIEGTHLSRSKRHVIRRTFRSQSKHEPHALLRIGKGQGLISGYSDDRWNRRRLLLLAPHTRHFFGQRRDRRSLKHRPQRDVNFKDLAHS